MGSPDDFSSLIQLGFAAATAGWLVRWLTTTQQRALDNNTSVVLSLQLYIGEMYRLLLLQDALIRGLSLEIEENSTPAHQAAVQAYNTTIQRLDSLKQSIEQSLESL